MTEHNPEQDTQYDKSIHELLATLDGGPLDEALANFDTRRAGLYDSLSELTVNMPSVIALRGQSTVDQDGLPERFAAILQALVKEGVDSSALTHTATGIMVNDSSERADLMNMLLDEQHIAKFKPDDLKTIMVDCIQGSDTIEQAIDAIESMYQVDLSNDVETFVHLLFHKHQHLQDLSQEPKKEAPQETDGQTIEIKKDFKDHASDIAKIALGVTVALAFDRFIHKKP